MPVVARDCINLRTVPGGVSGLTAAMANCGGNRLWSYISVLVGAGGGLRKTGLLLGHGLRVGIAIIIIIIMAALPILLLGFKIFGVKAMLVQNIDSSLECLGVLVVT